MTVSIFGDSAPPADFFAGLCGLGRDNQILAATSSAELLGSVLPEQVIDLSQPRA